MTIKSGQREVLKMLAQRSAGFGDDRGALTSSETFADSYNVFIHWRTGRALRNAGMVTFHYIGSGDEGDGTSVALTLKGWKEATR